MNYTRNNFFLTILVIAFPLLALAGGSSYSRYGFGDILRYGDSRIYALGGTGIALLDDGFINGLNPAGMTRISFTRFSGGFEYIRFSSKDENGSSLYSKAGFQGLSFAFPISRENGMVLSLEATPYSAVRYAIDYSHMDSNVGYMKHQTFYGSGGLSFLGIGLSGSLLNTLHVGGRFNYMYGRTRQYQTSSYDNVYFASASLDESVYYSGFTFTFGTIYEGLDELLNASSLHNFTLGFTLTTGSSLDADGQRIYSGSDTSFQKGTAEIPLSLGLGFSYLYHDRYRFLGDLVYENWENAKPFVWQPSELRNSIRISYGFESMPLKGDDSYWKRIIYRLGFAHHSTYYHINGTGINELLLSGGVGLPIGSESRLNIGLQVGMRGSTDNKLQKDTIIRLSIAISASEIWFLKFEEE